MEIQEPTVALISSDMILWTVNERVSVLNCFASGFLVEQIYTQRPVKKESPNVTVSDTSVLLVDLYGSMFTHTVNTFINYKYGRFACTKIQYLYTHVLYMDMLPTYSTCSSPYGINSADSTQSAVCSACLHLS